VKLGTAVGNPDAARVRLVGANDDGTPGKLPVGLGSPLGAVNGDKVGDVGWPGGEVGVSVGINDGVATMRAADGDALADPCSATTVGVPLLGVNDGISDRSSDALVDEFIVGSFDDDGDGPCVGVSDAVDEREPLGAIEDATVGAALWGAAFDGEDDGNEVGDVA
jgi:hypothetical protein